MMGLLVFKERLRAFYGRHSLVINPILKFLLAAVSILLLDLNLGYMTWMTSPVILLALSLVCAFTPLAMTTFITALVMLAHLYGLCLEMAAVADILVLVVTILYGGFQPGNSILMVIVPLLFFLKIPYVAPLILGLSFGLSAVIPMSIGIFMYYLIVYASQNAGVLAGADTVDIAQKYTQILDSLFTNSEMVMMIAAFAAALLVVLFVRNLAIDYAWSIATAAGTVVLLAVVFIGSSSMEISFPLAELSAGILVSVVLAFIYQFFAFAVDYTRTEFLQFEEDDYYYDVKAVPKIAVSAPDVKVQRINKRKDS